MTVIKWSLATIFVFAIALVGHGLSWPFPPIVRIGLAGLTAFLGVNSILKSARYYGELDELARKIELDAYALSYGVSIVLYFSYSILEWGGWVERMSAHFLFMSLTITYLAGCLWGKIRYR